jgi:hypothetical protein
VGQPYTLTATWSEAANDVHSVVFDGTPWSASNMTCTGAFGVAGTTCRMTITRTKTAAGSYPAVWSAVHRLGGAWDEVTFIETVP